MTEQQEVRLREAVTSLLEEAVGLRFGNPEEMAWDPGSGAPEVMDVLRNVRQRLDRVDEIVAKLIRLRHQATAVAMDAKFRHDEAWANENVKVRQKQRSNDFVAPRERYADTDLAVFDLVRALKDSEKQKSFVESALEEARVLQRGLDGIRSECITSLRAFQFMSTLES